MQYWSASRWHTELHSKSSLHVSPSVKLARGVSSVIVCSFASVAAACDELTQTEDSVTLLFQPMGYLFCRLVISHMQLSRYAIGRLLFRYCCINLFIITPAGYFNYLLTYYTMLILIFASKVESNIDLVQIHWTCEHTHRSIKNVFIMCSCCDIRPAENWWWALSICACLYVFNGTSLIISL